MNCLADVAARQLFDVVGLHAVKQLRRQLSEPNLETVRHTVDVGALLEGAVV